MSHTTGEFGTTFECEIVSQVAVPAHRGECGSRVCDIVVRKLASQFDNWLCVLITPHSWTRTHALS